MRNCEYLWAEQLLADAKIHVAIYVLHGNHRVSGMATAEGPGARQRVLHSSFYGQTRGQPRGSRMSPLTEELVLLGLMPLPTAEQGDCGLEVMAYWDGLESCTAVSKAM